MTTPSDSPPGDHPDLDGDDAALIEHYAAQQPRPRRGVLSAARHFLKWARSRGIAFRTLDAAAVERFARHHCRCGRYSPGQLRDPGYMANVRRFFRYLQQVGIVPDGVNSIDGFLAAFAISLDADGYSRSVRSTRFSQARHFAEWVRQSRIPAGDIDRSTVEQFAGHDCRCGIRTKRGVGVAGAGSAARRRGARQFVDFLRQKGAIPPARRADVQPVDPRLARFEHWLRHERGVTGETVRRYRHEVGRWLGKLGADPADWDAAAIRAIVLNQGSERSRSSTLMTVAVLRPLLRFLVSDGQCSLWLGHASIQTTEMYLRANPAEKLAILEAHSPPLLKSGSFREPSDKLMAVLTKAVRSTR